MKITTVQNKILHALLSSAKMMDKKSILVLSFTDGRSESSRDMLSSEAQEMIHYLNDLAPTNGHAEAANKMRRKILAMCHRIHWVTIDGKVDIPRINGWCREKSFGKKDLNDYAYNELPKLVTEFQQVYKYYVNKSMSS